MQALPLARSGLFDVVQTIAEVAFVCAVGWLVVWGKAWAKRVVEAPAQEALEQLRQYNAKHLEAFRQESAKRIADDRQFFESTIEMQRREHATQLESIKAEHSRRGAEVSLYARERHRAYPRIYRRYRLCLDQMYHSMIGRSFGADGRDTQQAALDMLRRARNVEVLEDLYMSDGVRDYVDLARSLIAGFSAEVTTMHSARDTGVAARSKAKYERANLAVVRVRDTMREELRTATDAPRPTDEQYRAWMAAAHAES